jgi:hypothetical protein
MYNIVPSAVTVPAPLDGMKYRDSPKSAGERKKWSAN